MKQVQNFQYKMGSVLRQVEMCNTEIRMLITIAKGGLQRLSDVKKRI